MNLPEKSVVSMHEEFDSELSLLEGDEDIDRASRSLKAMSHPLRLKILCTLGDEEVSVQDIVDQVGTSQSNISQHLAILRDKGILTSRKDANRVFYRVSDNRTLRLICMMREVFCTHTEPGVPIPSGHRTGPWQTGRPAPPVLSFAVSMICLDGGEVSWNKSWNLPVITPCWCRPF